MASTRAARPSHWPSLSLETRRPESPLWTWLALVGLVGAVILAVLGLPTMDLHGLLHYAGIMDPLCGATRSVYLTMHGHWEAALRYNPAAPFLLVAAAGLVLRAAGGWWTGRWVHLRLPRRAVIALVVVVGVILQVRQQNNAALLTAPWTGS